MRFKFPNKKKDIIILPNFGDTRVLEGFAFIPLWTSKWDMKLNRVVYDVRWLEHVKFTEVYKRTNYNFDGIWDIVEFIDEDSKEENLHKELK